MQNKITAIEAFIEAYLSDKWTSEYCRTEARILNSFLNRLITNHGYDIRAVHDGEQRHAIENNNRFDALHHIFSVDNSVLYMSTPDSKKVALCLLIGEGEAQTIYDHVAMTEEQEELIFKMWAECVRTHDKQLYNDYWA